VAGLYYADNHQLLALKDFQYLKMKPRSLKQILILVVSILLISPLFWDFFSSALHYLLYLFILFIGWIVVLYFQSLKSEDSE